MKNSELACAAFFILNSKFEIHRMDYKRLLSKVEKTLAQIESSGTRRLTIEQIAETIATNFRDELGITGGRIYEDTGQDTYELVGRFGVSNEGPLGIIV